MACGLTQKGKAARPGQRVLLLLGTHTPPFPLFKLGLKSVPESLLEEGLLSVL